MASAWKRDGSGVAGHVVTAPDFRVDLSRDHDRLLGAVTAIRGLIVFHGPFPMRRHHLHRLWKATL
jgi:hypothetical protein